MLKLTLICLFIAFAVSNPVIDNLSAENKQHLDNTVHERSQGNSEEALIKRLNLKCAQRDVGSCVMLKLIFYMNRMLKKSAIELNENIEITKTSSDLDFVESRSLESGTTDSTDESQVSEIIADKLWRFIQTRSLKWKMMDDADLVISGAPDKEGTVNIGLSFKTAGLNNAGDSRGKKNNLGPLIAAAAMKIGLLKVLAIKGLALMAGKALIISKIALVIAVIIGLKKLFSHQKHVTYEVVSHPHHSHSEAHSSGHESSGWGRSLAYRAHVPETEHSGDIAEPKISQ